MLGDGSKSGSIGINRSANKRSGPRHVLVVLVLCVIWYFCSSAGNIIGKLVLNEFPFPVTITLVQLASITLYSGPFFNLWRIRRLHDIPRSYYWRLIIPLAFGKFFSTVTSHISLWKVPVSYAHTVKATMPLFTVILTRVLFGEKQPRLVYLSLVPIIAGVGIASMTELSFDVMGLISALVSTLGLSLQNIFSKKVLKDTGIHHLRLLHLLGKLALYIFLPFWMYTDSFEVFKHPSIANLDYRVISLLFADGVLNWLQNILAFSILSLVVPLTYAVASASKRIFVIGVSILILGNPVTPANVFGMFIAILGVLCYNRAKHITRTKEVTLPTHLSSTSKYTPLRTESALDHSHHRGENGSNLSNGSIDNRRSQHFNSTLKPTNSLLSNADGMIGDGLSTRLLFV